MPVRLTFRFGDLGLRLVLLLLHLGSFVLVALCLPLLPTNRTIRLFAANFLAGRLPSIRLARAFVRRIVVITVVLARSVCACSAFAAVFLCCLLSRSLTRPLSGLARLLLPLGLLLLDPETGGNVLLRRGLEDALLAVLALLEVRAVF